MTKKRLLFIYNPFSGKGLIRNKLMDIIDTFVKSGYEVTVHPTQERNDARRLVAQESEYYDQLVCSGGDGTLDEVVSGMMESAVKIPIGYIPAGSTNDFAQSLKIPKNMRAAADVAVNGDRFPCDIGGFNDDFFVYIAAFGLFTDVSYLTNQNMKNLLGHVAYLLEGAKRLMDIPRYHMTVEVNGEVFEDDFAYGMVTNSISVGGIKNMTGKSVLLDDGVFEVTLIKYPTNPVQLNEIITNLMMPKTINTPYIYTLKTDFIKITCEEIIAWTLDGEFGGEHKTVEICNNHKSLDLMVKKQTKNS